MYSDRKVCDLFLLLLMVALITILFFEHLADPILGYIIDILMRYDIVS